MDIYTGSSRYSIASNIVCVSSTCNFVKYFKVTYLCGEIPIWKFTQEAVSVCHNKQKILHDGPSYTDTVSG
jgi:hypothetical protein